MDYFDNYIHHGLSGMIHITKKNRTLTYKNLKSEEQSYVRTAERIYSTDLLKMLIKARKGTKH